MHNSHLDQKIQFILQNILNQYKLVIESIRLHILGIN